MHAPALHENRVEVDMVPYIDIVSLLLMFLLIVGDMTKSTTAVKMRLPQADQAVKDIGTKTAGRVVVQLRKDPRGSYQAVIENNSYALEGGQSSSLSYYLKGLIEQRVASGAIQRGAEGEVPFPVKLRIPEEAPMSEVERVMKTCAALNLVNLHYAAAPPEGAP